MILHISTSNGVPIYLQIVQQVRQLVASGRLLPGDDLPTIRALARQLLVNPNTVARAYRELEHEGLIDLRQGSGSRVSGRGSPLSLDARLSILGDAADRLVTQARQLAISADTVLEMVRTRLEQPETPAENRGEADHAQ
jgi:GntR family transcriptional regulator